MKYAANLQLCCIVASSQESLAMILLLIPCIKIILKII